MDHVFSLHREQGSFGVSGRLVSVLCGLILAALPALSQTALADAPTCQGQTATIYVESGIIVGGPHDGQTYAGTLNGTSVSDVIVGTSGADTISGNGGSDTICAGAGDDRLSFSDGAGSSGTINAGDGSDMLDFSAYTSPVYVTLTSDDNSGTSPGGSFVSVEAIQGGSSSDNRLTGRDAMTTWHVTANDSGDVNGAVTFADFASLNGGSNDDRFVFSDGTGVSGWVYAGGGSNTLDYSPYSTPVAVHLGANVATGTSRISNIANVIGGSAADTITGMNTTNAWVISGGNAGTLNAGTFTNVEKLVGGVRVDTFTFDAGGSVSSVNGSTGTDRIDTSALGAITANITTTNGGSLAGAVVTTFTGVEGLTTGAGDDTFVLSNVQRLDGKLDAGAGRDTLSYAAYTTGVMVNLATGAAKNIFGGLVGGVSGIDNVVGGSGNDSLTGDGSANVVVGNSGNDTLNGGDGADILIGGNGTDSVSGGNGNDLLLGGYSSFDSVPASLNQLISKWTSDALLGNQIAAIQAGSDAKIITSGIGKSVFNDASASDTLAGAIDADWYVFSYNDITSGFTSGTDTATFHL